jgi:hypothetical protein
MKPYWYAAFAGVQVIIMMALCDCGPTQAPAAGLSADVDAACGGPSWRRRHALAADITVRRAGRADIDGQLLYDIRGNRLVIQLPIRDGEGLASFGVDANRLWRDGPLDLDYADWTNALQWAAWVAVPYHLTEPTLRVHELQPISVVGARYRVAEIERPAEGPGLCILYVSPDVLHPRGAVPVCAACNGTGQMASVYALKYERFELCDDVTVPSRWSVWPWDAHSGVSEAGPIASVELQNLRFVDADPSLFESPAR